MQTKIDDYLAFGVSYVWVVNPAAKRAWVYSRDGMHEAQTELRLDDPPVVVPLSEVFTGS
jgi:Uma2 family endonuclease